MRPRQQDITDTITELRRIVNDKNLERRLSEAARRDRAGTTVPDGYRTGAGGPGPVGGHSDPTLSAVQARESVEFDRHRDHWIKGWGYFTLALSSLQKGMLRLEGIEELVGHVEEVPACELCAAAGYRADSQHFSDVTGILESMLRLCSWHYDTIYRTKKVPTHERVQAYAEGRRWRERAS